MRKGVGRYPALSSLQSPVVPLDRQKVAVRIRRAPRPGVGNAGYERDSDRWVCSQTKDCQKTVKEWIMTEAIRLPQLGTTKTWITDPGGNVVNLHGINLVSKTDKTPKQLGFDDRNAK